MSDQPTCGDGLAQNAALPAALGDVIASMAEVLEAHTEALDLDDEDSRRERDVYVRLVAAQRDAAARLRAIHDEMAASRDLPMGRHDPKAMASREVAGAFAGFVVAEEQLVNLLGDRVQADREMLDQMRRAGG